MHTAASLPQRQVRHSHTYDYAAVGSERDVTPATRGGVALMGGGADNDEAFRWLLDHAGGGDVLVLRASGGDDYNPYLYQLAPVNSVGTMVTRRRAAAYDPFVPDKVRRAEAIFIAGGDQAKYVKRWKDTPLEAAINEAVARGVPIGGTSAGLAVLCDRPFTAEHGTVTSEEALADPRNDAMTLGSDFLAIPGMRHTVTDSHFHERDRMGRLVAFVADIEESDGFARGLGVDERTAVLVEADGHASVVGPGAAYLLASPGLPASCVPGRPLEYADVPVTRFRAGDAFTLSPWPSAKYTVTASEGNLTSSAGAVY